MSMLDLLNMSMLDLFETNWNDQLSEEDIVVRKEGGDELQVVLLAGRLEFVDNRLPLLRLLLLWCR